MHASKQSENWTTWSGNVRKSRSSIFCFSCTSSCSFVERVKEKMWMVAVAFLIQSIIPGMEDETHLTRKIMMGEMMRTRRRIAIPNACCWFAVFNSLSTVSLNRKIFKNCFHSTPPTGGVESTS